MRRFIEGDDRQQVMLMPEVLDDYVGEDNSVRAIDLFVDELNLVELGFKDAVPATTGRPGYHPAVLLKIYIYGYLNKIQSSRRLERETQRNVELMWLARRLTPDFKTIADFRRDNGLGIRNVCKAFIALCRQLDLFSEAVIAIDGSKFKAVNNRDKNFTPHKLEARMKQVEESIERYLATLDTIDRTQPMDAKIKTKDLKSKLTRLRRQMKYLEGIGKQLKQQPDGQLSLTDPDARSMATSGRGTGMVGYNVQTAVDTRHHLIVAHEVTNEGHDRNQLAHMATLAKEATGSEALQAIADRGYYKGPEILKCEQAGITPLVPKTMTSDNKARGLFDKRDFVYIAEDDEYRCPAGERAIFRFWSFERDMKMAVYWSSSCLRCALHAQCTTGDYRRIHRWEHEGVLDAMQKRLDAKPGMMKQRRCTVEHVFGTLKFWMGSTHFLMRTLKHVRTEMSLHVLSYNLRRVMSILGVDGLMKTLRLAAT